MLSKAPYIVVLGDNECNSKTVSVRTRGSKDTVAMSLDEFKAQVLTNIANRALN